MADSVVNTMVDRRMLVVNMRMVCTRKMVDCTKVCNLNWKMMAADTLEEVDNCFHNSTRTSAGTRSTSNLHPMVQPVIQCIQNEESRDQSCRNLCPTLQTLIQY